MGALLLDNQGENNLISAPGEGVPIGLGGSIRFDRMLEQANLFHFSGILTVDTNLGTIEHSDGSIHYGLIEDRSYLHNDGTVWPYSVCHFIFEEIHLGGSLIINLKGDNGLLLEAASGDFVLGTDLKADGGNASVVDGSGGVGLLGGFKGAPSGMALGVGPGKAAEISEQGHGLWTRRTRFRWCFRSR